MKLSFVCEEGDPCAGGGTPETVRFVVSVGDRGTTADNPMRSDLIEVSVRPDWGPPSDLPMSPAGTNARTGKAEFANPAAPVGWYRVTIRRRDPLTREVIGQARERVQLTRASHPMDVSLDQTPTLAAGGVQIDTRGGSGNTQVLVAQVNDQSTLGEIQIEFLDANKQPIDVATTGLRYGLFDHAAEKMNQTMLTNGGALVAHDTDPILNEEAETKNFVGSDSRRFHIRVKDPSPKLFGTLPSGNRVVEVSWRTLFSNGSVLDENGGAATSTLTLEEESAGVFTSRALMHVTTRTDQVWGTHCGIPGLHPGTQTRGGQPIPEAIRHAGQTDHRLRRASMFGKVEASYDSSATERVVIQAPVFTRQERKRAQLQILVVWDPTASRPTVDDTGVFQNALRKMRECYERIGVFVATATHTVAQKMVNDNVTNAARKDSGADFYYVVPVPSSINVAKVGDPEEAALGAQFPAEGNDIRMFFIPALAPRATVGTPFGVSHGDADTAPPIQGTIFLPSDANPLQAVSAHELGHVLTNKSSCYGFISDPSVAPPNNRNAGGAHYQRPPGAASNAFIHFYNLMGGTRFRLWDVTVTETPDPACPHATKHLTAQQFNQIRSIFASRFAR